MKELTKNSRGFNFKAGNICNVYGQYHKLSQYDIDLINTMQTDTYQPVILDAISVMSLGFKALDNDKEEFRKQITESFTIVVKLFEDKLYIDFKTGTAIFYDYLLPKHYHILQEALNITNRNNTNPNAELQLYFKHLQLLQSGIVSEQTS